MRDRTRLMMAVVVASVWGVAPAMGGSYTIVDTGQTTSYDNAGTVITPASGQPFYGQDAQHAGNQASYTTSGDGKSVMDNVTGLTWTKSADWTGNGSTTVDDKFTYDGAQAYAAALNLRTYGGHSDWRVPSTKELYSLIDFRGVGSTTEASSTPFIDTTHFDFAYGDVASGERFIDSQWVTGTKYVSTVMGGSEAMFGVNFADGRIKGYGLAGPNPQVGEKTFYARFCRGNTPYGDNNFADNGNGTISDSATDLMWSKADSQTGMNWEDALAWVQQKNDENHLGHNDWRLPNAKELHSIVDYSRSPDTTRSAAIDPLFDTTGISDDGGNDDYPYFWTSTTFLDGPEDMQGRAAIYIAFGEAEGYMEPPPPGSGYQLLDVHGAGAQRGDPKSGVLDTSSPYYMGLLDGTEIYGNGPQGDIIRIDNYARLVRDAPGEASIPEPATAGLIIAGSLLLARRKRPRQV